MIAGLAAGALIWASVYAGLSAFLLLAARLFPQRGYALLGGVLALIALSAVCLWLIANPEGDAWGFWGTRGVVLAQAFAPVLNTHFLVHYVGVSWPKGRMRLAYAVAAALMLGEWGASLVRLSRGDPLLVTGTDTLLAVPIGLWFGAHVLLAAVILHKAVRLGRRYAIFPLVCVILLGPAAAYDVSGFVLAEKSSLLAETLLWIYALSVVLGLLWELQGAEGKLRMATSSLAERTRELEVSYAELEVVQTELFRKEQLAVVGELAAAIAHEVRNPLAIIMNAASGMRRPAMAETDKDTLLSIVDEEARRLNQLVEELLRFSRPIEAARVPASLSDICEQVRADCPAGYDVVLGVPDSERLGAVLVDASLFRLALDNLVANATQAMPKGGKIELSVESGQGKDGATAAIVTVRDSGVGMSKDELERAKKPFFTTKPRGTGLGLAIADRIVEAHGGTLSLESTPGAGTTVTLVLPIDRSSEFSHPSSKAPHSRRRSLAMGGAASSDQAPSTPREERDAP